MKGGWEMTFEKNNFRNMTNIQMEISERSRLTHYRSNKIIRKFVTRTQL